MNEKKEFEQFQIALRGLNEEYLKLDDALSEEAMDKIYAEREGKENALKKAYRLLFQAKRSDAWGKDPRMVYVFDQTVNNVVIQRKESSFSKETELEFLSIPPERIRQIKSIISTNQAIFDVTVIPPAMVLDGSRNTLFFSDGSDVVAIETNNLWYWFGKDSQADEATKLVLDVYSQITEILIKEDVPRDDLTL